MIDLGFWLSLVVVAGTVGIMAFLHELDERRWRREREAEQANRHAAE